VGVEPALTLKRFVESRSTAGRMLSLGGYLVNRVLGRLGHRDCGFSQAPLADGVMTIGAVLGTESKTRPAFMASSFSGRRILCRRFRRPRHRFSLYNGRTPPGGVANTLATSNMVARAADSVTPEGS
jgi:hypothetical protein